MGSTLPAAGVVSAAGFTTAQMKAHQEVVVEILKRMIGVGEAAENVYISTGNLAPTKGIVNVRGEGDVNDVLDTIDITGYADGSTIVLFPFQSGNVITVTHNAGGSGSIILADSSSFSLTGTRSVCLRRVGTVWFEWFRNFSNDFAAARAFLGLGDAATGTQGPGNGFDADLLDGLHASAFLLATAQAADSAQLGGVAAAQYLRKNAAALQTLDHNLDLSEGRLYIDNGLGQTSGVEFQINDVTLARLVLDDQTTDRLRLEVLVGGAPVATVRLSSNGAFEYSPDDGANWYPVWHEGNDGASSGLDADLAHGVDAASIFGTGGTREHSVSIASLSGSSVHDFTVPSAVCWAPRITCATDTGQVLRCFPIRDPGGSLSQTRFRLENTGAGALLNIEVRVRYIDGNPSVNV